MQRRHIDITVAAAIFISLAANGNLLLRWRGQHLRTAAAVPASAILADQASVSLTERWRRALPGLRANGRRGKSVALSACELRTSSLHAQLAELDDLRLRHMPPDRRFEEEPVNAALTTTLVAALARQLPERLRSGVTAECHGSLCRLSLPGGFDQGDWLAHFRESEWVGENLHQVGGNADGILFAQHQPGAMRSSDLLLQALQDFEGSGAIEGCQARFSGAGTLDAEVSLAASDHAPVRPSDAPGEAALAGAGDQEPGIAVQAGGRLAGTPLGNCIDGEFRRTLAALTLPPHFEDATLMAQFPKR
jgi:hypothetical protein